MAQDYKYTSLYYGTPCQVRFYSPKTNAWTGGIAVYDYIICGHSGEIFFIEDVILNFEENKGHFDDAIIEMEWIDISNEIIGE